MQYRQTYHVASLGDSHPNRQRCSRIGQQPPTPGVGHQAGGAAIKHVARVQVDHRLPHTLLPTGQHPAALRDAKEPHVPRGVGDSQVPRAGCREPDQRVQGSHGAGRLQGRLLAQQLHALGAQGEAPPGAAGEAKGDLAVQGPGGPGGRALALKAQRGDWAAQGGFKVQ